MTVFFQNARSVLRVSHGTVPGPAGGGPNGAPARRLWPTRSMLPVCGRCGSLGGSCAPLGAAAMKVRATAADTDSASRLPERIANLLPNRCPEPQWAGRLPLELGTPIELSCTDRMQRSSARQGARPNTSSSGRPLPGGTARPRDRLTTLHRTEEADIQ